MKGKPLFHISSFTNIIAMVFKALEYVNVVAWVVK